MLRHGVTYFRRPRAKIGNRASASTPRGNVTGSIMGDACVSDIGTGNGSPALPCADRHHAFGCIPPDVAKCGTATVLTCRKARPGIRSVLNGRSHRK